MVADLIALTLCEDHTPVGHTRSDGARRTDKTPINVVVRGGADDVEVAVTNRGTVHGGTIGVESSDEHGTTFTIRLPKGVRTAAPLDLIEST